MQVSLFHKLDICVAYREGEEPLRVKTSKLDLLLIGLYPPPLGDWATDKLYEWADKMVHAAPSRCCVVVGGDLNAHVGYMRHPERDALNLERETMGGECQRVHANFNGARLSKFCRDQHMVMVNTHYPRGGPTTWNALRGREVESRLDYILLPAMRLQMVTHCFVLRREGRPHRRDHWPLMIRANLELLYGGVTMAPRDAVALVFFIQSCPLFVTLIGGYLYSKNE